MKNKLTAKDIEAITPPFARKYDMPVIVQQPDTSSAAAVILLCDGRRYAYFYASSLGTDYHVFDGRTWNNIRKDQDILIWYNTSGALMDCVEKMYQDMHLGSGMEKPFRNKCRRLLL